MSRDVKMREPLPLGWEKRASLETTLLNDSISKHKKNVNLKLFPFGIVRKYSNKVMIITRISRKNCCEKKTV
jgi:hypothetical protein